MDKRGSASYIAIELLLGHSELLLILTLTLSLSLSLSSFSLFSLFSLLSWFAFWRPQFR